MSKVAGRGTISYLTSTPPPDACDIGHSNIWLRSSRGQQFLRKYNWVLWILEMIFQVENKLCNRLSAIVVATNYFWMLKTKQKSNQTKPKQAHTNELF